MSWIKMRTDLLTDPRIVKMARLMNRSRVEIIGCCYGMWCVADQHTTDGFLEGYTALALDLHLGVSGFTSACEEIGWVEITDDGIRILRFDEHNGQSAKQRAQAALRVKRWRNDATVNNGVTRSDQIRERKHQQQQSVAAVAENGKEGAQTVEHLREWANNQAKRPVWLPEGKPWIGSETWLELAREAPSLTASQFEEIIAEARRNRNFLRNPAGLIIKRIREYATGNERVSNAN